MRSRGTDRKCWKPPWRWSRLCRGLPCQSSSGVSGRRGASCMTDPGCCSFHGLALNKPSDCTSDVATFLSAAGLHSSIKCLRRYMALVLR